MTAPNESARPTITVQRMCAHHEHDLIVRRLKMPPSAPWRAALVIAQMLLFQHASVDDRVWKRSAGEVEAMSLVLAEIGCLACWSREAYRRTYAVMRKGLDYASLVSRNKIADPVSPFASGRVVS